MNWRTEHLPEEMQENPAFKDVADVGSLAKQFVDLQSHIGNSIRIPSEEAGEADLKSFHEKLIERVPDLMYKPDTSNEEAMSQLYSQLGKPENAEAYKWLDGEVASHIDAESNAHLREIAHKANLNQSQFNALLEGLAGKNEENYTANVQRLEQSKADLKNEWGAAFDDRIKAVADYLEKSGAPEALVNSAKEGNINKETASWVYSVVEATAENVGSPDKNSGNGGGKMTPSEALSRIDEIYNNPNHPFYDQTHPSHQRALEEMVELAKFADPQAGTDAPKSSQLGLA